MAMRQTHVAVTVGPVVGHVVNPYQLIEIQVWLHCMRKPVACLLLVTSTVPFVFEEILFYKELEECEAF